MNSRNNQITCAPLGCFFLVLFYVVATWAAIGYGLWLFVKMIGWR